ncbi:unnamed protein product [Arctogadus glacialis]
MFTSHWTALDVYVTALPADRSRKPAALSQCSDIVDGVLQRRLATVQGVGEAPRSGPYYSVDRAGATGSVVKVGRLDVLMGENPTTQNSPPLDLDSTRGQPHRHKRGLWAAEDSAPTSTNQKILVKSGPLLMTPRTIEYALVCTTLACDSSSLASFTFLLYC